LLPILLLKEQVMGLLSAEAHLDSGFLWISFAERVCHESVAVAVVIATKSCLTAKFVS
jgi:hypothetical protein